jgi:hypothetical protein
MSAAMMRSGRQLRSDFKEDVKGGASRKRIGLAFGSQALGFRSEVPMENNFN